MADTTDRFDAFRPFGGSEAEAAGATGSSTSPVERAVATPLAAVAFWSAIALPALYLPLVISGLNSVGDLAVFFGLFGLHLAALLGGRTYRTD